MRVRGSLGAALLAGLVAACGGGSPTQAPGAATQNPGATTAGGGGSATEAPGATQSGGGGNIETTFGKVTFTITGPVATSAEFGFIPGASLFGGAQGSILNFSDDSADSAHVLSIIIDPSNSVSVTYSGAEGQVPGAKCTTSDWNIGSTSGSGRFECDAELSITGTGATAAGGHISGTFTAHT